MDKILADLLVKQQAQIDLLTNMVTNMNVNQAGPQVGLSEESLMEKLSNAMEIFTFSSEEGRTFDKWYRRYHDIFAEDGKNLSDAAKVRLLLRKIGTIEHNLYLDHILPKAPADYDFKKTIEILTQKFSRQESLFSIRWKCLQASRPEGINLATHAANINRLCEEFQLKKLSDDQFKCLIFIGSLQSHKDKEIRARLLSKVNSFSVSEEAGDNTQQVTLDSLVEEAQRILNLHKDTSLISSHPTPAVSAIKNVSHSKSKNKAKSKPSSACWNCGGMHYAKFCEFKNHKCTKCNKMGHKEGYCKSNKEDLKLNSSNSKYSRANVLQEVNSIDESNGDTRKYITATVNNQPVHFQIDTAADVTLISKETWDSLGNPSSDGHQSRQIKCASNQNINIIAEFEAEVKIYDKMVVGKILVTSNLQLFGIDFITKFGLWDVPLNAICNQVNDENVSMQFIVDELKSEFPEVFENSTGQCKNIKAHLTLKDNVSPVYCAKRPVPYAALNDVETELERLESLGIISPVEYSTWAAPIVVVRKSNGKVRICADFSTGLNNALESNQYPLPLLDDIFAQLSNSKCFTKIDLADAFLQFELDFESKKYLTINTHKGLFQYNRLPFGVKTAPAIFQCSIEQVLSGIDGVIPYIDDILIHAPDSQTMSQRVKAVLKRLKHYNLRARLEKCEFYTKQVRYLGYIIDQHGVHSDPKQVEPILNMPSPSNIQELRSFLGAINYYGKFLPRMYDLRAPLNHLLNKNVKFIWDSKCQNAFERFKEILCSDLLLAHFNPSMPVKVSADASNNGIGACISHVYQDGTEKAIAHASRTLTETEKRYSQIEKEGLALVFATKKFHRYIYGRKFQLVTDHKPLLSIFGNKKGIPVYTANRLQRWALNLLSYDFEISYTSTDKFGNADVLSRLISNSGKCNDDYVIASIQLEEDLDQELGEIIEKLPVSRSTIKRFTNSDKILKQVRIFLQKGWPNKEVIQDKELLQYFYRRESLSMSQGCLMFSERIIIPEKLRKTILKQLHKCHTGMEAMKMLARSYIFWPKIDEDIKTKAQQCSICAENAKTPVKTLLHSWPRTIRPLERIHIDIAGPVDNKYYLVIVDSFSMVPAVYICNSITSKIMIEKVSEYFSWFGNAETLVSDNGTQFVSTEFEEFCQSRGCRHITSPPYHPMSNGRAERFVDTLKRSLKKIKLEGGGITDLNDFLQRYRTTPNRSIDGKAPIEMLLNKTIRTNFDLLKEDLPHHSNQRNIYMENQFNQHHGSKERTFEVGQQVLAKEFTQNKWYWSPGKVMERIGSVMYVVWLQNNKMIRVHTNQLKQRHYEDNSSTNDLPLNLLLDINSFPTNTKPTQIQPTQLSTPTPMEILSDESVPQAPTTSRTRNRKFYGNPGVTTRSRRLELTS